MCIDSLPTEILARIAASLASFGLYECCLVNKRFYTAFAPLLWRDIAVESEYMLDRLCRSLSNTSTSPGYQVRQLHLDCYIEDDDCLSLMRHLPQLESLNAPHAGYLTDRSVIPLVQTCLQLQEICLHSASITYRSLHYFSGLKRLRRLDLSGCSKISSLALFPLQNCPLELLNLSLCRWLTAEDTAVDLQVFCMLKELSLICCSTICKEFMCCLLPKTDSDQAPLPNLHAFSLTGDDEEIDDDVIVPFVQSHPRLRSLILMACAITDRSLLAMRDCLADLQNIEISYCSQVSSNGVRQLIHGSPQLEMVGVKDCTVFKKDFPEIWTTDSLDQERSQYVDRLTFEEIELIRLQPCADEHINMDEGELVTVETPLDGEVTYIQTWLNLNGS
ncbi:hypothetical protein DFQ28_009150 [Apophysomyces sp. BC1034]|nr:hypothetical protein DFQ30_004955 [Apophysomyces sp. BC1015]KAG0173781.1 hypothetical protein DFQ29_007758 [Apophysomyces sp. BC1021]KAG0185551.1 hypothetical protein DFQ28_009150 [Apophysomyces sp. BC1034]